VNISVKKIFGEIIKKMKHWKQSFRNSKKKLNKKPLWRKLSGEGVVKNQIQKSVANNLHSLP